MELKDSIFSSSYNDREFVPTPSEAGRRQPKFMMLLTVKMKSIATALVE